MITDTIHRKNCIQQKEEKPKNVIKWAFSHLKKIKSKLCKNVLTIADLFVRIAFVVR